MNREGHITVFLSLILLCMSCLVLAMVESARTAGTRWYLQMAADSAMDSLFSQYHLKLWENYRLFGLEYWEKEDLERQFDRYFQTYEDAGSWYPVELDHTDAFRIETLTGYGGEFLKREVLDYMKYGIWNLDVETDSLEGLPDLLKEASAVDKVSETYGSHTRSAFRLEEALEAIEDCQQRQKQYYEEGIRRLERYDGPGFRQAAGDFQKEAARIEKLVHKYEKQADQLGKELDKSRSDYETGRQEMGNALSGAIEQEMEHYRAYTDADGERRLAVRELPKLAEENMATAAQAAAMAEAVEDLLDEWDDEEDEPDEEELWEPVLRQFQSCRIRVTGVNAGIKDKEKQKWLERLKSMSDSAILSLVLPEGRQVSGGIIPAGQLPSHTCGRDQSGSDTGLLDRVLVNEYCGQFFTDFVTEEPLQKPIGQGAGEEAASKREVHYEMEYLAAGGDSDKSNLTSAVMELVALREGLNLLHLLTDSEKREEAYSLAQTVVGFTGIGPLVLITAFFIMVVWALGESIADVQILMKGGHVPLAKTRENWNLSLEGLLDFGKSGRISAGEGNNMGLGYQGYLKLLLLLKPPVELYYRMMDVIQMNLSRFQPDFQLSRCAYRVDMRALGCGKHVFFSIGIVDNFLGMSDFTYPLGVEAHKAY